MNSYYYTWLLSKIDSRYFYTKRYNRLLWFLYSTNFDSSIPMDQNREMDGVALRNQFYESNNELSIDIHLAQKHCSVLEVLIALADRCEEDIMQNSDFGDRTGLWFSIMIDNLGLSAMNDANFNQQNCEVIIRNFLERSYSYNGDGGIFPLVNPLQDMRQTDLWYQMCWYLNENFEN